MIWPTQDPSACVGNWCNFCTFLQKCRAQHLALSSRQGKSTPFLIPHRFQPPKWGRVPRNAIIYFITLACCLHQMIKPFSYSLVVCPLWQRGLYLWRQGSSRVFLCDDWLHRAPAISLRVSGTKSDCIDLVAHCPVGKVFCGKYQNTINNTQLPSSALELPHRVWGTRNTSVTPLWTKHQSGEGNRLNWETSEAAQGCPFYMSQVHAEVSRTIWS